MVRCALADPRTFVDGGLCGSEGTIKRKQILKNLHFDGPDAGYSRYGRGRIWQVRYKHYFIRLDYDFLRRYNPYEPIYHLNIGSSQRGKINYHLPVNPRYWGQRR
jgi:hypothetical protein